MLDQLLATDTGALTADHVRDVLGLVEEETVEAFIEALVRGEAVAGIELLDGLEERGRDLRAFTEQAMERLRLTLLASLGRGTPSGLASAGPGPLSAVARRLASIDPAHPGPGGLRLQLELTLLAPEMAAPAGVSAAVPAGRPAARASAPAPAPAPARPAAPSAPAAGPSAAPVPARPAAPSAPAALSIPGARTASPAVPSASSESSAPPAPRARTGPTLQLLLERWAEIVELISKSPPAKPLIVACRPVAVDGSIVTLGFPEAQSFYKDVAERRRTILEDGVSRVLGMPVSVRCVAANVEIAPLPQDPDSTRLLTEFKRIYGDDVVDIGDVG
jgi:DNA polymerase-3 subunit gamma/tau